MNPCEIDFVDSPCGELIAESSQCSLVASYHHGATCHPIESMWYSDEWFRSPFSRKLSKELSLQAWNPIRGLGEQVDWFVNDQEPCIFQQNGNDHRSLIATVWFVVVHESIRLVRARR
jgi:hypothetical protein